MSEKRCQSCGAGTDAVQRYCLNCGARVGEPRLDFRRYLVAGDAAPPPPAPAGAPVGGPSPEKPQRDFAPLAAAGGIAVLGLMLLVGVLIGRGGEDQAAAPAPQVVRVQGGGEAGDRTVGGKGGGGGRLGGGKRQKPKGGGKSKNTGNSGAPPPAAITADDSELEALQAKSPQEYSEASAKLPDEIATEGKPPPEDNKKAGGGSAGVAIE